ncbi:MAG: DNA primase [Candidatus Magasanikbacteria bacterium]
MSDTQTIKDRLDIAQVIGEYIQLKKAGANYKARCPFHNEKSPSFMVHPEKQIWHCFGCGKGGDIFSFVQEIEGLDFPEALRHLAERAGVKLDTYRSEIDKSQKNRIVEVNQAAAVFFHRFLTEIPSASGARAYLTNRQISSATIVEWQVGFIPDQWELLTQYLVKKGFAIDDLVASGLTIKKEGAPAGKGFYDRFRGRIMFPIRDAHGSVVGFTGRVLVETDRSGGKYVNTPQTLVYDKSRVLYGLDKAKMEIKHRDLAVIVEGQMDVIACHQAGMKNVVASSGTALTGEQVKLLKRYSGNIAMAFDADNAGQEAMKRGIDAALSEGMSVKVISIPAGAGKDADECIKKDKNTWFQAVENAQEIMSWYFTNVLSKYQLSVPHEKQLASTILIGEIAKLTYAVERDDWLRRLSEQLNIDSTVLREELKKAIKNKGAMPARVAAGLEKSAAVAVNVVKKAPHSRIQVLAEGLWSLLMKWPELYPDTRVRLQKEYFVATDFVGLYEISEKQYNETKKISLDDLRVLSVGASYDIDILSLRAEKDFSELSIVEARKEAQGLARSLADEWKKNYRQDIQMAIANAEKSGEKSTVMELIQKLQSI